jgi:hypothetical protein
MNAGTRVSLPTEHFELHIALRGHVSVESRGDSGDVIPPGDNVLGGSDECGDRLGRPSASSPPSSPPPVKSDKLNAVTENPRGNYEPS